MKKKFTFVSVAAAAFSLLGAVSANATVFTLGSTTNADGKTVSATADITNSGDVFTILLTNLSPSLSAPNQGLSDLLIDFEDGLTSFADFTQAGNLVTVNPDGTTTAAPGAPTHWGASLTSGNLYLTALTGGQPEDMIAPADIGTPNGGVGNFNPYIDTTATFTLTLNGLTTNNIKGVRFSFGTNADEFNAPGDCVSGCGGGGQGGPVPEPATWAMMILGFGATGAMLRRRHLVRA